MGYAISKRRFPDMLDFCSNIIFLTRDPHRQFHSTINVFEKIAGRRSVSVGELAYVKFRKSDADMHLLEEWDILNAHAQRARECTGDVRIIAMDGDSFTSFPEITMRRLSKVMGIQYTSAMIHGWKKGMQEREKMLQHYTQAYIDRVSKTHSIAPMAGKAPSILDFPPRLQTYLETCLSMYSDILMSASVTVKPPAHKIASPQSVQLPESFGDLYPVSAYAMCATQGRGAYRRLLPALKNAHPEHENAFAVIDDCTLNLRV
jgi:hypothetical protein